MTDPIDQLIAGQPDAHLWKRWEGGDQAPEDWDGVAVIWDDCEYIDVDSMRPDTWGFYWTVTTGPNIVAYRIKSAPTRETVTIEKRTEGGDRRD